MNPVAALREIGFLLERSRADTYRVRAYRGAADVVAQLSEEERHDHQEQRNWAKVRGVGPKTATVITQAIQAEIGQREYWPLLAAGALLFLLIEWYAYHRRLRAPTVFRPLRGARTSS